MTKQTTNRVSASGVRAAIERLRKEWGWTKSDIINLLRQGGNSSKGSTYERDMCRQLSLWWTADARDDVFWRTSGSGARAKVRGRSGAATAGQHGDIGATDPIGAPLIDIFTIELKRGYSEYTFQDLIDRNPTAGVQEWERFLLQTIESQEQAGSLSWLLITRRDRRRALVWVPWWMLRTLQDVGAFGEHYPPTPFVRMRVTLRDSYKRLHRVDVCGMTLNDWLAEVTPEHIQEVQTLGLERNA